MILGIINKDSGSITWNNLPVERKNVNFGYLPEERGIYPKTNIYEQLLYFAELRGMKKDYKLAINESVSSLKEIYFSGGKVGLQVKVKTKDFLSLKNPIIKNLVK